ncbi:MAG: PP2C family protein-serine/threonine phosphatase, partial [Armatimonadota bacterium]
VWELVVACCEFVESGGAQIPRDAYRLASEIGRRLTERLDRREAVYFYRDLLMERINAELADCPEAIPPVMTFFIAVGDALWEAFVEQLRSDIRQEKRQRLTEQLRIAKRIQQHLLPKTIPQVEGFDFAGRLVPAEEVGGDYWSIKNYPQDQTITMKLADVSGHGIGAATLVAAVKFISGGYYRGASSPQEVMERTNQVLVKETPNDILVTMIYGWLNPVTRVIRLVNAGHSPVFIARADGFHDIEPTGPVLGVLGATSYSERQEVLHPGDILVFASDGITEAGSDRRFGTDRLKQVVWDHRREPARDIADAVIDAVMRYDVTVPDDLSIVVTKSLP